MGQTIRFGVSLDSELLDKFDALCEERCYQTRSEAIRDLIRNTLIQKEWEDSDNEIAGDADPGLRPPQVRSGPASHRDTA